MLPHLLPTFPLPTSHLPTSGTTAFFQDNAKHIRVLHCFSACPSHQSKCIQAKPTMNMCIFANSPTHPNIHTDKRKSYLQKGSPVICKTCTFPVLFLQTKWCFILAKCSFDVSSEVQISLNAEHMSMRLNIETVQCLQNNVFFTVLFFSCCNSHKVKETLK